LPQLVPQPSDRVAGYALPTSATQPKAHEGLCRTNVRARVIAP